MRLISLFSILIICVSFLAGCRAKDAKHLQDEALNYAKDSRIDEAEYNKLAEMVKASKDGTLAQFLGAEGEIDNAKLADYLLSLFTAKKLNMVAADIWRPAGRSSVEPFNINVYIENSASMDGYVKGVTEFETAIYNLLADFKISGLAKNLNLSYINKQVTYTKTNALQPDIQDFIEKLEPSTFAQRGGDRGVSDLQSILKTVIGKVDGENAAILVSDFVFSPGKRKDAKDYLNNQTVGIKVDFAEKLKELDLSVLVIQLQSQFDGKYYDKLDNPRPLNCKRPYYIWVFGTASQIRQILGSKIAENIKGGSLNRLVFATSKSPGPIPYKILVRPSVGSFELPEGAKGPITGAKASKEKGLFEFTMAVNFPDSIQDSSFFLDAGNYRLSDPNYKLTVEPVTASDPAFRGFSHKIKLQTTDLQEESLEISVIGKIPDWAVSSSSADDSGIACNNDEINKTFGFSYLIEGVSDAFFPQSGQNAIYTTRVSIKK